METYELARGGWVKFNWEKDVQACGPKYENTYVTLNNGCIYLLRGRRYGV